MGRGITRRKERYQKDLDLNREARQTALERIRESRKSNWGINLAWRLLGPLILGLCGYLVAQLLGPIIPGEISGQTGHSIPSIIMGLVFVFIGRSVSYWMMDFQRSRIEQEYNARNYQLYLAYEEGKLAEFYMCRQKLCEAWEQYAGEIYPETASYQMVVEADMSARRKLEQRIELSNLSELRNFVRILSRFRRKKSRNSSAVPAAINDAVAS